jgi:hypothetical protein
VTDTRPASLYRWPGTIVKGWPHPSLRMRGAAATTMPPTRDDGTLAWPHHELRARAAAGRNPSMIALMTRRLAQTANYQTLTKDFPVRTRGTSKTGA